MNDKAREAFEIELRKHCIQAPPPQARDLASCMWTAALQWAASQQALGFPPRMLEHLRELASRESSSGRGPWQYGDGSPMQDDADAALRWIAGAQQAAPEGWRLVPVEPTMEMRNRGAEVHDQRPSEVAGIYRAMLAAAPAQQAAEGKDELQRLHAKVDALTREAWTWSKACESESMRIHGVKDAINKAYGIVSKEHPWTPEHSKNYPQQAANIINAAMTIFAPPATQGEREPFKAGEYERMTENGRKAWAGVDPQSLRDGSFPAQGERDEQ